MSRIVRVNLDDIQLIPMQRLPARIAAVRPGLELSLVTVVRYLIVRGLEVVEREPAAPPPSRRGRPMV